ncbi:hypothetical protein A4X09_0g6073 [Tilletia walkeri]|uniref:F-box domain-containing protein n=1 Tax=Tilletia walkeri TaxID=117179 RepID=A0A8X7N666_9BASI|nr:hypothetical protein A4X09_0g6073 [Tilletia walkeri]
MTSLSQSTCYNSSLTEAPLWLRLPIELHMLIFSYCDYFTLKQIQRVCKFFKPLLDTTFFNNKLFWPTPKPLSREDLWNIADKYDRLNFRLHPYLRDSRWCMKNINVGPVLLDGDILDSDKGIPLADLAVRNESATYPAVSCRANVEGSIWRCDLACPDFRDWKEEEFCEFYVRRSDTTLYPMLTVQDVVRMLTRIEYEFRTMRLGWPATEIWRRRSYPDGTETVSAFLEDGCLQINQKKIRYADT